MEKAGECHASCTYGMSYSTQLPNFYYKKISGGEKKSIQAHFGVGGS